MADRNRVNLTLTPRQLEDLHWLAAERTMLPAVLAREMVDDGIQQALADAATRARWERDRAGQRVEDQILPDILAALSTRGVPEVLSGRRNGASLEQIRVAAWLVGISRWLSDARPEAAKGPAPRLDTWANLYIPLDDVQAALEVAGDGDGLARRQRAGEGAQMASDKRQLSDTGRGDPGEVPGGEG